MPEIGTSGSVGAPGDRGYPTPSPKIRAPCQNAPSTEPPTKNRIGRRTGSGSGPRGARWRNWARARQDAQPMSRRFEPEPEPEVRQASLVEEEEVATETSKRDPRVKVPPAER
jgi:hypothetical protein